MKNLILPPRREGSSPPRGRFLSPFLRGAFLAGGLLFFQGFFCAPLWAVNNPAEVNPFDRPLMFPYSPGAAVASDIIQYTLVAAPFALAAVAPKEDYLKLFIFYAETVALTQGAKELTKHLVHRDRPYTYFAGVGPADRETDSAKSFYSGHSTTAFASAAFAVTVFNFYRGDSSAASVVAAGAFTAAAAVASLRVAGGMHFTSDVIVGALTGAAAGFLIPYLQLKHGGDKERGRGAEGAAFAASPGTVYFLFKL